jgi:ComF family protein
MLAAMMNPMPPALPVRLPSAVRASLTGRRAWRTAMAGVARTLDPWLPRVCALCESALALSGAGLCRHCRLGLPGRQRPRCARCGLGRPDSSACPACEQTAFAFDATCVLADYAPPLDRLIGALKFGGQLAAASALGQEMARALRHRQTSPAPEQLPPIDLIVAVPLSPARRQERGYDQAQAIARALGRASAITHRRALVRLRQTQAQSTLPRLERAANLLRAFGPLPGLRLDGAHIALVDDVMTTGATLDAAARALRRAGARRITAVVAARTE